MRGDSRVKYEEPYIEVINLQGTIITLMSGVEGEDEDVDLGGVQILEINGN